jgi:two-component sensor histidine kinase
MDEVKYGALSSPTGFLDVSSHGDDNDIFLIWAETGGPAVASPPELTGFRSRLIARSVSSQLGGELTYDWQASGLVVTVRMRQERLAA